MEGLTFYELPDEQAYIAKFCEIYKDGINTPDGFSIVCLYPEKTAKHFCCGGENRKFQKSRVARIGWAKYILLNVSRRKILLDTSTKNIIFFFEKGRTAYTVVCAPRVDSRLNLITGFLVKGQRAEKYRLAKPPYQFYAIKKSC